MTTNTQKEKLNFQAEVKQLLHLVTHSLYSNKEIFLRELISNSADACDKLRFLALSDDSLYENDEALWIKVYFDADAKTITIKDNGVGMNRDEVIANLGTIAKSGTREFLAQLTGDQAKDANLIGQFGVGFYSAFVVADKVIVRTRRAGVSQEEGVQWESSADGEYTVSNVTLPQRGTEITLHIKEDDTEFLDNFRLRNIITKYSDHILLPIYMEKTSTSSTDEEETNANDSQPKEEEVVNKATALWTLPKKDIKDEEYKELYKHITHDYSEPLVWSHNVVEGKLEYTTLLYIPERAPFDLWHRDHRYGLKLYAKRVFIMDNAEQLLPNYLRFVRGIVDSKDLPLNVSREILQSNKVIDSMRSAIVKRVLSVLENMAQNDQEKYTKFWSAFGQVMKEGLIEDASNQEEIAKLLRFATTNENSSSQSVSLDDYVSRMLTGQDKIYYITAESYITAKNSPHLEIFNKKGIEVLLLTDKIDEWMLSGLMEYQGKKLQSVAKGDTDISNILSKNNDENSDNDEANKQNEELDSNELESMVKQIKESLGDKVKDVKISSRLTESPVCLVASEDDMSANLQRIMMAAGQNIPRSKQILEINPKHPLIIRLKNEADDQKFGEWSNLLFEQAMVAEGAQLDDPASFVKRLNKLLLS